MAEPAHSNGACGVPDSRRNRTRRCSAPLLAVLLLLPAVLLQLPAAPQAGAQPSGSRTVDVSVDSITPSVPSPGDTVTVSGTLTNDSKAKITETRLALRVSGPLTSRSAVTHAASRSGYDPALDGAEIGGRGTEEMGALAPGVSHPFQLSIPVGDLPLATEGVYQLGVSVSGRARDVGYEQVLGIEHTFLPWHPGQRDNKTQLTFIWPLVAPPKLTARTGPDEAQTPVLAGDELLRELEPGGRLQQQLMLGKDLPVTWVIDPDLLASVHAMTERYRVRTEDGGTVAGKGQETARRWLDELQDTVRDREVVALPFGDTDVASLAHRGRKFPGIQRQLAKAVELGETTVESILHVQPETDVSWPVEGAIDPRIVKTAASAGATTILTRSDSLRDTGLYYTPTAARPIGGGRTAVVTDAQLSKVFESDMSKAENYTLGIQHFLSQTLVITLQQPNSQRSIVVAPQRTPSIGQTQAMAASIDGLAGKNPWMSPLNLSDAAAADPDPAANRDVPGAGAYPKTLRRQEIPVAALRSIRDTREKVADFAEILSETSRVKVPFGNALLRELSTQWRGRPERAAHFRESVRDYLDEITHEVELIEKSDLTLSGNSGTLPVTVRNNLVQDVQGLELRLTSDFPRRLDIEEGSQLIEVAGGHSTTVKFTANARASGPVDVTAQLYTPDGEPFGEKKTFRVDVTSITSTVLLVIGAGILLLVLAGVRMYTQRKNAARREAEGDGAAEGDEDVAGGDDTGAESGASRESSERVDR